MLLWLYDERPIKFENCWRTDGDYMAQLKWSLFPQVKWEDDEPTEIELVIKK